MSDLKKEKVRIPKRIKAPIIIKDDTISGFTMDDIDSFTEDDIKSISCKFKLSEQKEKQTVIDHDSYRKWLKDTNTK